MTAIYENNDLKFMYPDNWVLTENDETDDFSEVSLESPTSGIWSLSVFGPDSKPEDLLDACVKGLSEQYQDLETLEFQGELAGHPTVGFDAHFYCLDFLVAAQARTFVTKSHSYNVFCQAESREFDRIQEVFDAITTSFLGSIGVDDRRGQTPRRFFGFSTGWFVRNTCLDRTN